MSILGIIGKDGRYYFFKNGVRIPEPNSYKNVIWKDDITPKKSVGRKSVGRKSVGRKSVGRKSVGRKSVGRKSAGRKSAGRKSVIKKSAGRKSVGRKSVIKKSAGRKSAGRKSIERRNKINPNTAPQKKKKTTGTYNILSKSISLPDQFVDLDPIKIPKFKKISKTVSEHEQLKLEVNGISFAAGNSKCGVYCNQKPTTEELKKRLIFLKRKFGKIPHIK